MSISKREFLKLSGLSATAAVMAVACSKDLAGALGVRLDWKIPRDSVRIESRGTEYALFASGYPRPISGVPPERNVKGISFAVANATGSASQRRVCISPSSEFALLSLPLVRS